MSTPHPVDIHVGQRVRLARLSAGLSQSQLAGAVGITFQQVQKYEKGTNRISASRLYQFANILGVDIPYFFQGADNAGTDGQKPADEGVAFQRVDVDLLHSLADLDDTRLKRELLQLVRVLTSTRGSKAKSEESNDHG